MASGEAGVDDMGAGLSIKEGKAELAKQEADQNSVKKSPPNDFLLLKYLRLLPMRTDLRPFLLFLLREELCSWLNRHCLLREKKDF